MRSVRVISSRLAVFFVLTSLIGCVSQPKNMYQWGGYETQVYNYFTQASSPEMQIETLEKHLQTLPDSARAVPPGYHAHLGMLYGQVGRYGDMATQFETEKLLYPESTVFMEFLLRKKNNAKNGDKI